MVHSSTSIEGLKGGTMPLRTLLPIAAVCCALAGLTHAVPVAGQAPAAGVTVFEGMRLIAGDGRAPIENAALVMDGGRITRVGRSGDVQVPANATRISLSGKTVIPALIDTHVHLSTTREALINDLR